MRDRITVGLMIAISSCAGTQRRDPERAEQHYNLGVDYFSKGLVAPALEETMKSLEFDDRSAETHNLLGLIFLRQGAEALQLVEIDECLEGPSAADQRAEADGKMKRARAEFGTAITLQDDFSEAYNNLSVVALHFKEYDKAIEFGRKALGNILYRQPFLAHGNVGWAYYERGDLVRAAKELRQAVFHQPEFCVGRYRLAKVYHGQKNLDAALEQLDQVVTQKCPIQEAYHLAGMIRARRQEIDAAKQLLQDCIQLAPRSCEAKKCQRDVSLLESN